MLKERFDILGNVHMCFHAESQMRRLKPLSCVMSMKYEVIGLFLCSTGAATPWSLRWLHGNLTAATGLQQVTSPGQEVVQHMTPCKTTTFCFYALVFLCRLNK